MSDEPRWRRYLRFRGPDIDADIDDELRFHLEMRERDFLAAGKSPEEARAAAGARFGDVRAVRDWLRKHDRKRHGRVERAEIVDRLLQDARYGVRKLRQQPAFTGAVLLILGVGIGATAAIFSAVDAALLRPLAYAVDDRLVEIDNITTSVRAPDEPPGSVTPDITDLRSRSGVFAAVAAYASGGMNFSSSDLALRVRVGMLTPSFFATWGVQPALGRPFVQEEGEPGGEQVALVSDGLWHKLYGGDPGIVGRFLTLNGKEYRVVGVMPPGFAFPNTSELWIPLRIPMSFADWEPFRQVVQTHVIARITPHATLDRARVTVQSLFVEYGAEELPGYSASMGQVRPLREVLLGNTSNTLVVLLGATILVLLIAGASVGNLLLSQAMARRREFALRLVLGATRGRLTRQLLVEGLLLSVGGGLLGLLLAYVSLGALESLLPAALGGATELRIDLRVQLFTLVVSLLTGLVFSLSPVLRTRRINGGEVARMSGTASVSTGGDTRTQKAIVLAEIALALMLLVGTGVMLRSLQALLSKDTGIQSENVATVELTLASADYSPDGRRAFIGAVLERLREDPSITAAGAVNELPLRGEGAVQMAVTIDGRPADGTDQIYAQDLRVSPDYFRVLRIPILRGRTLTPSSGSSAPREVVINQTLARRLWGDGDPIGQYVRFAGFMGRAEVVGVAGDVLPTALDREGAPQVYASILSAPTANFAVVARGQDSDRGLIASVQAAVREANPSQATYNARTMDQVIAGTLASRRASTQLFVAFSMLALALATIGVYGIISYGVARRTREIGIRMALGAHPGDVVLTMMRDGVVVALGGIGCGLLGAWILSRALAGMVYGVRVTDSIAFGSAAGVLLVVSVLASLLPALKAARVDPGRAMRME